MGPLSGHKLICPTAQLLRKVRRDKKSRCAQILIFASRIKMVACSRWVGQKYSAFVFTEIAVD
jgi:hypothetical protein